MEPGGIIRESIINDSQFFSLICRLIYVSLLIIELRLAIILTLLISCAFSAILLVLKLLILRCT